MWNHNVEFIEQETPWARPAVFIEFGEIAWVRLGGHPKAMRGTGTLHIHLVTDWVSNPDDDAFFLPFSLSERIHRALSELQGEHFHGLELLTTHTNHNHEELLENIDTFRFVVEKEL